MFDSSIWRLALRGLQRHRRANVAIVAILALLAGVLVAVASIGHNLLISPWTYDTDRLGVLRHGVAGAPQENYGFAPDEYRAVRDSGLFEVVSASQGTSVAFGDGSSAARSLTLIRTTPSALRVSDASPLLGRFVDASDGGEARQLAISHALWQSDFGGRADVLGDTLLLNGQSHSIVGVMPQRFHFIGGDLWSGHPVDPDTDASPEARFVVNFKLREGSSIEALGPALAALAQSLPRRSDQARYPPGWRIEAARVIDAVTGPQRPALMLVLVGAAALLLLGVLNVAALLLSRQIADATLLSTRQALGEARWRTLASMAVESLLLASIALLLALGLGRLLFDRFVAMMANEWVPRELEGAFVYATPALWTLPLMVLGIAAALTLLRLPGLMRIDPRASLAGGTRSGGRRGEARASHWLSGLQIAIATAVTVCALAIASGADALAIRDLGFQPESLLHARLTFPLDRYPDVAVRAEALDRIEQALQGQLGASAVGFTDSAPMQRYARSDTIRAWSGPPLQAPLPVDLRAVHGDIGAALGLRLLEGRLPDPLIDLAGREPVVVVSRSLAQRLAPDASALGASLTLGSGEAAVTRRVVGVVDDVRHESALAAPRATLYLPYRQDRGGNQIAMLLRLRAGDVVDPGRLAQAVGSVDPWIALRDVNPMPKRADAALAGVTLARTLFGGFALLGVLLATLGIAAVAALGVARRRHEFAVRSAIGATPRGLLLQVMRGSIALSLAAAAVGTALAWLLVHAVQAALQGSAQLEPLHLLATPAALVACAVLATLLPARNAMQSDPLALLQGRA